MKRQNSAKVVLTVNGRRWTQVVTLQNAGPHSAVYVVNHEDGNVIFGDGSHGRTPQVGNTVRISYKYGSGSSGNISRRIPQKNDIHKFWVLVRDGQQAIGWGKRPC